MSTRCHVELWDAYYEGQVMRGMDTPGINKKKIKSRLGVRLYHHSDGYPEFMRPKLKKFLPAAYEYLKEAGYPYWWDSERVGAVLIALSIEDYSEPLKPFTTDRDNTYKSCLDRKPGEPERPYRTNGGVPVFQPCMDIHGDVEYIWKVQLGPEEGQFKISYRRPTMKELGYTDEEIEWLLQAYQKGIVNGAKQFNGPDEDEDDEDDSDTSDWEDSWLDEEHGGEG